MKFYLTDIHRPFAHNDIEVNALLLNIIMRNHKKDYYEISIHPATKLIRYIFVNGRWDFDVDTKLNKKFLNELGD